ncbi:hypothetical protein BKA57DRAFT_496917 [Linnemannia elongata]|nr:hypothetical protein BKA57DRAFT_496917 [Linnemannia elongata]
MLQAHIPNDHTQGFRAIHKTQRPSTFTHIDPDDIIFIDCHTHPDTNRDFILWEDIQQAFEEALFVRHKAKMLPFVKGTDLRPVEPRRIAAVPDSVLDVVVGGDIATPKVPSPQLIHYEVQQQDPALVMPKKAPSAPQFIPSTVHKAPSAPQALPTPPTSAPNNSTTTNDGTNPTNVCSMCTPETSKSINDTTTTTTKTGAKYTLEGIKRTTVRGRAL